MVDSVSLERFQEVFSTIFVGQEQDQMELIFDMFDFNHDGIISQEDMKVLLNYLPVDISKINGVDHRPVEIYKQGNDINMNKMHFYLSSSQIGKWILTLFHRTIPCAKHILKMQ